jgi:hypothetical protein
MAAASPFALYKLDLDRKDVTYLSDGIGERRIRTWKHEAAENEPVTSLHLCVFLLSITLWRK